MTKHLPNTLTCLNLITGAMATITITTGDYQQAIYFVLVAGLFDFLDGFVARLLKVQSSIGKELDSLADMVSFGLVPALYMFRAIGEETTHPYLPYAGLLIAAFSALRLAKFNVDDSQSDQFIGVPTPANTILITSLAFLPQGFPMSLVTLLALTVASSLLLVANVPMIALKFKGAGWSGNELRYSLIIALLALLAIFKLAALPMLIPIYIFFSLLGNFVAKKGVSKNN
ncbi:CDP-diacylglycerol--serine O-phosphatidyltransferase [Marinoscillum sp.]|uniref:CDP-diacylglycerol--serine O-phosphatidyltransferase n=1 Tax=Marinoscillum sp. TaxID=2024838 RepID=UPI003BAC775B